ncbi:MAG: restriction endonuclease subunit S [Candidatus Uhrbacteria bacterium]|nr:restriction endonuclease subunit S [Candidatus Uhrbacteria bacterium]
MQNDITQLNIPIGWKRTTLGKIASITNGSTNTQDAVADGAYPLFDRSVEIKKSSKYLFDDTAIILPGEGAEFVPKIYSGKFDLHQRAYAIFPNKSIVSTEYLYHFLYANRKDFAQKSVGSTVRSLRLPLIQSVGVSIPPIKEQQKIAEIMGTVDEDIAKTQEVIKASEKLKRGLMQQLFTRGIGHTKFKVTKIGQIPDEWEVLELGKVCDVRDGTHSSPKYHEEGVPLITSKNLVDTTLDFENVSLISEIDFREIEKRSKVDDGDILFGMIGTIGNPVIVKKDRDFAIKNVALIKFADSKMNNVFALNFLKSTHTEKQFNQKKGGSTQKFIALGVIRQILITVPSITEQKEIAEILSSIDEKIMVNRKLKEKFTLLKKGLMWDLLSGKVRTSI